MNPARLLLVLGALIAASNLPAQRQPTPRPAERFDVPTIETSLAESGHAWRQFLGRRSLSCGIYRLPKGATDTQSPHDLDEVYYVLTGRATLEVGPQKLEATPGSVLFVQAGAPHRFVDITEDLSTLVFFSTAQPTRGGMAAGPRPTEQTPYDEGSERGSARIFYWFGSSSAGQLDIHFGRPAWQPAFESFLTRPSGKRWRLGENFWTTLDTNIPLEIGGVELGIGQYYLVLENSTTDGLRLIALDPQEIRRQRFDAYEAPKTTGGTAIPLTLEKLEPAAQRLQIALEVDRSEKDHARLLIRFGPHQITAPVVMKP
jgi:mannose-6-phosphate isomerase-like protein (cupin superfamily)